MSNKGMNLGGVHTLDDIKARCEEVGDCWEWQRGFQNHRRSPATVLNGQRMTTRRAVAILTGLNTKGLVVLNRCGNPACVNPDHLTVVSKRKAMGMLAPKAVTSARNAKISASKRAGSPINQAMATEVRVSNEPSKTLAQRLGISATTIQAIRRGERGEIGNVWAGLLTGRGKAAA